MSSKRPVKEQPSRRNIHCLVGTVRLAKIRFLAYIGGMDLEAELTNLNASTSSKTDQLFYSRTGLLNRKGILEMSNSLYFKFSVWLVIYLSEANTECCLYRLFFAWNRT